MKIAVFGCGYLGAVHAACLTFLGHEVVGIDVNAKLVGALNSGIAPFFEPGLDDLLVSQLATGRLVFSEDPRTSSHATAYFLCVGTPQTLGAYTADLTYVDAAMDSILPLLSPGDIVVGKSTVPVGTAESLAARVHDVQIEAELVWNPEFLREGRAIEDTLHPDRLVYGASHTGQGKRAVGVLDEIYSKTLAAGTPKVETDLTTSQLVKVAANSFLATKISFINAMADLCDATGADVVQLADALGHDERIGRKSLNAGLGFGGGCLPKDIRAFMARADELGIDQALSLLREVDSINQKRRDRVIDLTREACGGSIAGRRIAILGASFKPDTDDIRDSPSLNVADQMRHQGASVVVTDPMALHRAHLEWPHLSYADNLSTAVAKADAVLVLTDWTEYVELRPQDLEDLVSARIIIDGRNCLDPGLWRAAGWTYRALGRP